MDHLVKFKTSTIKGIASVLNCDIYILPISKDALDHDLVGAFTYILKKKINKDIIVIEDIFHLLKTEKKVTKTMLKIKIPPKIALMVLLVLRAQYLCQ